MENKIHRNKDKKPYDNKLKTSMVDNLAKELDYNYIKLNLSQISDPSDLVGWPCKEHYACKDDECAWISAELIPEYLKAG